MSRPIVISTNQGNVTGKVVSVKPELTDKKCISFQGIPFGRYERFQKPTRFGKWKGTLDGTEPTPKQYQFNLIVAASDNLLGLTFLPDDTKEAYAATKFAKNTLHLSVTTPENFVITKKKPVMVYIHGGGWTMGGAEEYFPAPLCTSGDVVVVVISYRLGVLGFGFGNFALWDQLEALKWVQENISAYGGDKDNVTIFGQSAGSWSVECLMSSEKTVGYFHRAISQSGCVKCEMVENDELHRACMEFGRTYFGVKTNLEFKNCLYKCNENDTLKFIRSIPPNINSGFTARTDNDDFLNTKFNDQESFPNKVPFMTGMGTTEHGFLEFFIGGPAAQVIYAGWTYEQMLDSYSQKSDRKTAAALIEKLRKVYSAERDMSGKYEWSRLHILWSGNNTFMGLFDRSEAICEEQPVYNYQLNVQTKAFHKEPFKNGNKQVRLDFCRSDHMDDLMYMWGLPFSTRYSLAQGRYFSNQEKRLSRRMMRVWSDFAKTGNPGWKAFDKETRVYKEFNSSSDELKSSADKEIKEKIAIWRSQNK